MHQSRGNPAIIDLGSGVTKAGFAGEDAPRSCFPSVVGRAKSNGVVGVYEKDYFVGQEAIYKREDLNLVWPIQHGISKDWDGTQKILHHCYYNQLRTDPHDHPCLLTQTPQNPIQNREKLTQIMFQTFDVPSFYLAVQQVLSLSAAGKVTGLVLDLGESVTHAVPIYESSALCNFVEKIDLGGRDLSEYLTKLINQNGIHLDQSKKLQILSQIKEKFYVSKDFQTQINDFNNGNKNECYQLPDGSSITLKDQRIRCPEVLFRPKIIGKQMAGINQIVHQSIKRVDADLRGKMYQNIILSGGSSMFQGLRERLDKQLRSLVPSVPKLKVIATPQRKHFNWIGGSILSSMSTFQNRWITKDQYNQCGPSIVNLKCF